MCTPCQKTWPKLEGCEPKGEDFGEILDEKLILQTLLTSPTSPGLHLYAGHCAVHYAVYACQYVLRWLLTFMFRVPLQGIRLSTFFARLALYIILLLPAMICGLAYWAFAGKDILSMKYKEPCRFGIVCWILLVVNIPTWCWPNQLAKADLFKDYGDQLYQVSFDRWEPQIDSNKICCVYIISPFLELYQASDIRLCRDEISVLKILPDYRSYAGGQG